MNAKRMLVLGIVAGLSGIGCALWAASGGGGASATSRPAGGTAPAASLPADSAYPLWDGNETQSQYAKRAGIKDVEITLSLDANVTMKLLLIPAGKFMMGSPAGEKGRSDDEGPQHQVTMSKPIYMGIYSVTQGQWKAGMGTEPWKGQRLVKEGVDYPATYVSWDDALEFCKKLSQKTGKTVRLPTEAEWEYGCRAGTKTRFYYGDDPDCAKLGDYAWYKKNAWDPEEKYAHVVGQKKRNDWGLYDMHGNVWEWCSDWYDKDHYANANKMDPVGPASGSLRVLRGGSWIDLPQLCRTAIRLGPSPGRRDFCFGFRVSVDLK